MKLKVLIALLLFFFLPLSAHAKVTFGIVASNNFLLTSKKKAQSLAVYFAGAIQEKVKVRFLGDEKTLHEWLSRYREVDVAVPSRAYFKEQSSVEFYHLADYFLAAKPDAPAANVIVARQGIREYLLNEIKTLLLGLPADLRGRKILQDLGVAGFVLPGERLPVKIVKPSAVSSAAPVKKASGGAEMPALKHVTKKASPKGVDSASARAQQEKKGKTAKV